MFYLLLTINVCFVWWPQFSPPDQLICQQNLSIFPRLTRSSVAGLLNCQPAAVGGQRSRWQTDNQYWQWCAAPVSQPIVSLGTQCRLGKTFHFGPSIDLVLPVGQLCWLLFAKNSPRPNELKFHHARRTGQWRRNINAKSFTVCAVIRFGNFMASYRVTLIGAS